ncbi:hypothetical protein, partial [Nocardia sp. NPDC004260]
PSMRGANTGFAVSPDIHQALTDLARAHNCTLRELRRPGRLFAAAALKIAGSAESAGRQRFSARERDCRPFQ